MKTKYKTLLFIFLLPAILFANHGKLKGKYTKEKTINKEYVVNPNAELQVKNSYGNIDIITWNENRTVIVVTIRTNGNDEVKVQQRLDDITVEFTGNASLVTAKTKFKNKKKYWKWWGSKNNKISIEINYTIKIPVTNSVDLNNNYGAISINKLEGIAKINCDYGHLFIGELLAEDNYLNFDYTSKSTIGYMKSGKINADYSDFTLDKVERLELDADYTDSEIIEATNINYNCDYGKVVIGKVKTLVGNGDYVNHRIGTVTGSLKLISDYGSIKIKRLTASVNNATIDADYTGIKIGFDNDFNFDFNFNLSYASFKGEENVTVKHSSINGKNKKYSGFHGVEYSGSSVNVNSEYGGLTLIKN